MIDAAEHRAHPRGRPRSSWTRRWRTAREHMPRQKVFAFGGVWQGLTWAGSTTGAPTRRVKAERLRADRPRCCAGRPAGFTPQPREPSGCSTSAVRWWSAARASTGAAPRLLAYGTCCWRASRCGSRGQDTVRGTFSHRHAALFDAETGAAWVPARQPRARTQASFEAVNSPLSEMAVLGFEYGMSSADPRRLVVWEAQFGDFVNGAQVIIDQFIAGAESKWQRMSGLVAAPAPRLRRPGPRALERPARALPPALRRGQHAGREPARRPPSSSTCSGARCTGRSASR